MGNCLENKQSQSKKYKVLEATQVAREALSSIEFYATVDGLAKKGVAHTGLASKKVVGAISDTVFTGSSYRAKFNAIAALHAFSAESAEFARLVEKSALAARLTAELAEDAALLKGLVADNKVKRWRERFLLISLEFICQAARGSTKINELATKRLGAHGVGLNRIPFYLVLSFRKFNDIKTQMGNFIRKAVGGS